MNSIKLVKALFPTAVAIPAKHVIEAEILNGVPEAVTRRQVRIFKPAKTAMQSGTAEAEHWKLDFDVTERWSNPLMGWSSSADTVQALRIKFRTRDAAINFAERQGYEYWVQEPAPETFTPKLYAENFKYNPNKLRYHHTK